MAIMGVSKKMKFNKFILIGMLMVLTLAVSTIGVSAGLSVQSTYSKDSPTFGGPTQDASNPESDDEDDFDIFVEKDIPILNDDTGDDLINFKVSFVSNGKYSFKSNDYITNASDLTGVILEDNASINLKLKARIPEDLDAYDNNLGEVGFEVGTLTITGYNATNPTQAEEVSFTVFMQRKNELTISDLDIEINNKNKETNIDDGDDVEDLKPGDMLQLFIELENKYSSRDEVDIEDVEIDFECNPEDELDIEDDNVDVGDLGPGDDTDETLELNIEEDAQDETITCTLSTIGVDENGATHGESLEFSLEIERKSHDIVIKDIRLTPLALGCDDSSFQVAVDILNLGKRDEDEAAVKIQSMALNINEKISGIVLDEDDSITETFVFPISAEDLREGKYAIQILTYYDNTKQTDTEVIQIDNMCALDSDDVDDDNDDFVLDDNYVKDAISIDESVLSAVAGKLVSIKVQLTNNERSPVDYTVALQDLGEFATSTSSKTLHLNPGQTSTVFLNLKTNEDAEQGGMYSASVALTDAKSGVTLDTQTFTVQIEGEATPDKESLNIGKFSGSTALYVLIKVVLVVIAIFLVVLIFRGGSKKRKRVASSTPKKMSDFEPAPKRRKK
jgi:hypothetical protein